jgi:HAD superfamily hydrolase (TIGR01549 family)
VRIRAVFFDLGGTLLKMRRDKVIQTVLRDEGISVTEDSIHKAYHKVEPIWLKEYGSLVLKGAEADAAFENLDALVLREARVTYDIRRSDELASLIRRRWAEVDKIIKPEMYEESIPLLRKLKSDGLRLGLISNAPAETIGTVIQLGLDKYLDPLVISGIVGHAKPSPEIFRHAMSLASVNPAESMHVGDLYDADVVGARNAGMLAVLVDRDNHLPDADCPRVERLDEITRLLGPF